MNERNKLLSVLTNTDIHIDAEAKNEIIDLWDNLDNADPAQSITVSNEEVTEAYKNVQSKIDAGNKSKRSSGQHYIKYAAAAALLLFAIGLSYLLIPQTVTVPHGETQLVELPDQSTVHLNSGSQISYSRLFNFWSREISLQGEAFFDVESGTLPFRVTTPNAAVTVTGTKFNIRYRPNEDNGRTSVFLSEGIVTLESLITTNGMVTLKPGEQSWISTNTQKPADPVPTSTEKALDWQQNNIAFEDQPLSDVFAELQRRFDITINAHPNISGRTITIYLSNVKSAESAIKDICRAQGLTYKVENGNFLVYQN